MSRNTLKYLILAPLFAGMTLTASAQSDSLRLAKTVTVTSDQSGNTRQFFGHVVAKETVDLAFQVGGQIVDFPVTEGQTLAQGNVIAMLDIEPFQLALDQAQLQFDQSVRTFERLERLQGGTVSQVNVDDAETQVKIADVALRDAKRALRNAELTAPFDALVASRNVPNFSTIGAGTPVVRLHDMSDLRIEIAVPEVVFQEAGANPEVTLVAKFPASDELFPLMVREFNAETSEVGQTYQITLGMEPPENLVVLPGSSVTVFATIGGPAQPITIPQSAIISDSSGGSYVMVYSPSKENRGIVQSVAVTIEPGSNGQVIVVSGLEDGQEIVASGANMLSDGEEVRRFTGFAN